MHIGMTEAMVKIGDEIWTVPVHYNFLVAINVNTGVTRYICQMTEQQDERLYVKILNYENKKLFFIPMSADSFAVYDLKTETIEYIDAEIPENYVGRTHYKTEFKFANAALYESDLYLFPCTFPAIIKMNPETHEQECYSDWVYEFEKKIEVEQEVYFRDCLVINDTAYLPSCCSNTVLEFNFKSKQTLLNIVGKRPFSTISLMDGCFFLTSKQGEEIIKVKSLCENKYDVIPGTCMCSAVAACVVGGRLLFFSNMAEQSVYIDSEMAVNKLNLNYDVMFGILNTENEIYYVGENNPRCITIKKAPLVEIEAVKLDICEEISRGVMTSLKHKQAVYREGGVTLEDYLLFLK